MGSMRKFQRLIRRTPDKHTEQLGRDLRAAVRQAARAGRDVCLCEPQQKFYTNKAEADADKSDAAICPTCNKERIRIAHIATTDEMAAMVREYRGGN